VKSEVVELINENGLCRATIEGVAEMLPEEDTELDNWITEAVRQGNSLIFMVIVFAAFYRERPVDAKHLVGGAKLLSVPAYLAAIVSRVKGDMPEYLLEGLRNTAIYRPAHATALIYIAMWCDEYRGGVYPDQLLPEARLLAPKVKGMRDAEALLLLLAHRANDPTLLDLLRRNYPTISADTWKDIVQKTVAASPRQTLSGSLTPILDLMPTTSTFPQDPSRTIRRAVARIGRNDPCHCGSGKKYKNCCAEKDRERLQQSSGVSGLTLKEMHEQPERHLTLERLDKTAAPELSRMDPALIPRHLLTDYFVRLTLFDLERGAEFVEKLGYSADLEDSWFFVMFTAARLRRKDIGERMMKLREAEGLKEDELRLSQRLLLAQDDPGKCLLLIEEAAEKAVKSETTDDIMDLAYSVGFSKWGALGLLLFRSALPLAPEKSEQGYEEMQGIRRRLNLSEDDPIQGLLASLREKYREETEAALHEAEEKFEAKRREVRALKESVEQLQKELARRDKPAAADSPQSLPLNGESEQRLRDLREKVKYLETNLKETHSERNELQRRLEKMQTTVEAFRAPASSVAGNNDADVDHEDDLLLPQDAEGNHPLRLIEFPRNFQDRLNEFPHHVARGAMVMLGRLAGGDAAAFSGAKRLKSAPTIVRQRIGIDFRLLFRLLPDRIQVVDLITRQELERRIKTLR
jgi:SEC-C motif-containing protein